MTKIIVLIAVFCFGSLHAHVSEETIDTGGVFQGSLQNHAISDSSGNPSGPSADQLWIKSKSSTQDSIARVEINSVVAQSKKMFLDLGKYHEFTGAYGVICGVLGIIAGAVLIDRPADAGLAGLLISLGGISTGFGLWEINVGKHLIKYGAAGK
jgi:hypothetical protein